MGTSKDKHGGDRPPIDTAALLAGVDIVAVIDARVPLTKSGVEYEACCPFHNESTPSFKVSPTKQFYHCFGCGANGDAIKFVQEHDGLSFVEACRSLGADLPQTHGTKTKESAPKIPLNESHADTAKDDEERTPWKPVLPVPADAGPAPMAHIKRGKPTRLWTYLDGEGRTLGYVARFEKSTGGKDILPLTWCRHAETGALEWRWISFPKPRPLYGLDRLAARPEASVLVVEGEKCADAAAAQLPDLVVISWPGGGKAVNHCDWSPLAGRKVLGWADCDAKRERLTPTEKAAGADPLSKPFLPAEKQPGVDAMQKVGAHVLKHGGRFWDVKIPDPGAKPDGWDIADAIDEGLTGVALADFLRAKENRTERKPPKSISTPPDADAGNQGKRNGADKGPYIPNLIWGRDGLKSCLPNVHQILAHRPEWSGVLGWNEFSLCVEKRKAPPYAGGAVGEWDAIDDTRTALWLAWLCPEWAFTPSSDTVAEVIETLARNHAYHPVRDYLRSLVWDGVPRLENWLEDYLGVKRTDYSMKVAKWWLMGAVNRVMTPGFKFDYCLVLEGPQGKGKSTALAILGGAWFGDTDLDLTHKDSMSALKGKWVYEIAELGALARSEEKRQKSFLSRVQDEYRPVYGRREIKAKRQLVFAGSTNEFEWNKDPTGGRRFWPVECTGEFNLDGLRAMRDQLFAEAFMRVQAAERCYPTQDEQRDVFDPEQLKVELQDSLVDAVHDWVYSRVPEFSLYDVAADCLKLDASKLTRDLQTRLGVALRKLGCTRIERRNGMTRYWYKPPVKNEASSTTGKPAQPVSEDDYVGF